VYDAPPASPFFPLSFRVVDFSLPSFHRGTFAYEIIDRIYCMDADDMHLYLLLHTRIHVVSRSDATLRHFIGGVVDHGFPATTPGYIHFGHKLCVMRQGSSAPRVAVSELRPVRISIFTFEGALLRFWDMDAIPWICAYHAVSNELVVHDDSDVMVIFKGLMSVGVADVVITRSVVHRMPSAMEFCGDTAIAVYQDGRSHSYV
jgi:hypothetical protein